MKKTNTHKKYLDFFIECISFIRFLMRNWRKSPQQTFKFLSFSSTTVKEKLAHHLLSTSLKLKKKHPKTLRSGCCCCCRAWWSSTVAVLASLLLALERKETGSCCCVVLSLAMRRKGLSSRRREFVVSGDEGKRGCRCCQPPMELLLWLWNGDESWKLQ